MTQLISYDNDNDNDNGSSGFVPEDFDYIPHAQGDNIGTAAPLDDIIMTASSDDIIVTASSDDFVMTESSSPPFHDTLNKSADASVTSSDENLTITTTKPSTELSLSDHPLLPLDQSLEDSGSEYSNDENDGNADSSDTGMQSNQSYWIFGDALNRFKTSCATLLSSKLDVEDEEFSVQLIIAKRSLKEILAVFLRMVRTGKEKNGLCL